MRALFYTNPNEMAYRAAPAPIVTEGELLVQITAAGICGSDMHAYHGHDARRVPPMVLGHEAAGVVLNGARAGQQVALNPLITCGDCFYCKLGRSNLCANRAMLGMSRQGAMAEQVTIPAAFAMPTAPNMNPVHASLMEPTACAWHAIDLVERAAFYPLAESKILVIGAGAIGILTALLMHHRGCRDIHLSDTNPLRRRSAENLNIAHVHDARELVVSAEYDIVFDAVGSTITRQTAVKAVRTGGVVMHIGLQNGGGDFDARKITLDEIAFLGTYTYTVSDLQQSLNVLNDGSLGDLSWVEVRSLADGARAFTDLDGGKTASAKIVLAP
ncbi:MAG: alcohol dehydrogenase catalytic domain-containing protein [Candidatus Promineifilaceae bacterium]